MPKATSDFYSEALFRCTANLQLDKAFRGLEEILCVRLVGGFICKHRQETEQSSEKKIETLKVEKN